MSSTASRVETVGWLVVMAVLTVFAIPWFMWGDSRVVAGLPLWLWWHIGWLIAATFTFWVFGMRAWGLGITGIDSSVDRRENT